MNNKMKKIAGYFKANLELIQLEDKCLIVFIYFIINQQLKSLDDISKQTSHCNTHKIVGQIQDNPIL